MGGKAVWWGAVSAPGRGVVKTESSGANPGGSGAPLADREASVRWVGSLSPAIDLARSARPML